jgi:trimeric autotransporter adhesin
MKRNLKQWAAKAAHMLLYATAMSVPMSAQQAPPSADTFALSATPKTNYGSSPLLALTNGATAFIQFNLSELPPNATVSKATLRLYVDAVTGAGTFDVYEVNTPWTEGGLNFTNAPAPGLSATGSKPVSISSASGNQFVLVDITTLVQDWVNGTVANNGIALKLTSSTGGVSFDSKESPLTSHEPELEITLATAGPAGPQGPQGPTGATGQAGPAGPQGLPGNLTPGSPYYLQNGTTTQTGASFNIDGNGAVGGTLSGNAVNSARGFQIAGKTMFNVNPAIENIAIGDGAGNSSATGGQSQSIGDGSGASLTAGNADVFIGSAAGYNTTTGNGDVYVGFTSGANSTTGAYNTFVGGETGLANTTGTYNTYLGFSAGANDTSGQGNTFLGDFAGQNNTTGSSDIYIGSPGLNNENAAIRIGSNQQATYIAGIYGVTTASGVPIYIDSTGHLGTGGNTNGYPIGGKTIFNANPAIENISIGDGAGNASATGGSNQIIGDQSGASLTSGNADVFMGSSAGRATTTGNGDVYIGVTSGANSTTGAYNTFVGGETGSANTTGNYNTYLGFRAGVNDTNGIGNTFLGDFAGTNNNTGSSDIYIGNPGLDSENTTIRIGSNQQAAYIAGIYGVTSASGVPVFVNSNGQLGTQTSSRRYKEEIREMGDATASLMKLRPVTFYYKREYDNGPRTLQYGLIAEEVAKVFPELVAYNPDGSPYTVRYQFLSSMLLNEVQKQYHRSQQQADVIEAQQQQIKELEERLTRIEKILSSGVVNGADRSMELQGMWRGSARREAIGSPQ